MSVADLVWIPDTGYILPESIDVDGDELPTTWLANEGLLQNVESDDELRAAWRGKGANGLTLKDCYIAGLDPNDADSRLIACIEMDGAKPKVSWSPDLNEHGTKHLRDYTVLGCSSLEAGDWGEVNPDNCGQNRFFKVRVSLPADSRDSGLESR